MIQIQRILCPIDFSPVSSAALEHAAALAQSYGAAVHALHVFQPPLALVRTFPQYAGPALDEEARAGAEEALRRMAAAAARDRGVPVHTVLHEGEITSGIGRTAREIGADLIVVGTHGRSGLARLALGSVTEALLRVAPCPVLTVPPASHDAASGDGPLFKRILCPIDFSEESMLGLQYALSLAQEAGGRVTLLHVLDWFVDGETGAYSHYAVVPDYRRQTEAEALMRLRDAVPAAARDWCDAAELVRAGRPYRQIVQQAEDHQADVIVMGIRGRGGADLMLLGSTTNRVVREAACPVLTVRAKQSQVSAHPP